MGPSPEFTPAALRACDAAARWFRDGQLLPALLMGLVSESESRAAAMLAKSEIVADEVVARWPFLAMPQPGASHPEMIQGELRGAMRAVRRQFEDLSPLPSWATEHLLLAAALDRGETGQWLRERGILPEQIEADIRRIYDQPSGPVDYDEPEHPRSTGFQPVLATSDAPPPKNDLAIGRILDAAANRACEGLRVVEDYVRFGLDDAHLTRLAKDLRHELAAAIQAATGAARLTARDTAGDVGTAVEAGGEYERASLPALLAANFQRAFQALRSLEEYAKLAAPEAARQFESIRYRAYTLERAIFSVRDSNVRLATARLYVLVDGRASLEEFGTLAETLVAAGVHVIQLRDKRLPDRELLARARRLRVITRGDVGRTVSPSESPPSNLQAGRANSPSYGNGRTLFILNDRPDLAVLAEADGVHVGQEELTVREVRRIVGPQMLVGVSTHSIEQARQAVLDGASYLGVGPTFASGTKTFGHFPGLAFIEQVAAEIRLPWFAIGGITAANLPQVLAAGATRIAVGGAVTGEGIDAARAARKLLDALLVP